MAQVFVKTKGPFLYQGHTNLNPGSVVPMDEDHAREFVERGMGEYSEGPMYPAPPPPGHKGGFKADGTPMQEVTVIPVTSRVARAMAMVKAEEEARAAADTEEELESPRTRRGADLAARLAQGGEGRRETPAGGDDLIHAEPIASKFPASRTQ